MPLDEINLRIISTLRADARTPLAQIAKTLGLSTATVHQRYKRLRAQGYITGSRIEVDWERLGLPVTALIFLAVSDGTNLATAAAAASAVPHVVSVSSVTGEFDLMAEVRAKSSGHLGELLDDIRAKVPGRTRTVLVLNSFVEGRVPPLDGDLEGRQ